MERSGIFSQETTCYAGGGQKLIAQKLSSKVYNKIVQVYCKTQRRKVNGKYKRFAEPYKMAV